MLEMTAEAYILKWSKIYAPYQNITIEEWAICNNNLSRKRYQRKLKTKTRWCITCLADLNKFIK